MVHLFLRINGCNGNEFEELETTSVQESIILFQRSDGPRKKGLQKQKKPTVWKQKQSGNCNQKYATKEKSRVGKKQNKIQKKRTL